MFHIITIFFNSVYRVEISTWDENLQISSPLETKQTYKGTIIRRFSAWAKRVENCSSRAEFPWLISVAVSEVAVGRCSIKKVSLKILQKPQGNTCVRAFFKNKVAGLRLV